MSDSILLDNPEEDETEKPDPRIKRPDLYYAAKENDTNTVISLLNESVPPTHIDKTTGWTALHWASMHGNVKLTKRLLEHGASEPYHRLNKIDKEMKLRKLMKPNNGTSNNSIDNDNSILTNDETNSNIIDNIEDNEEEHNDEDRLLEKRFNLLKNTPLLWATTKGNLSVIWLLITDGYSPNDVDDLDNNMLHLASAGGFTKILTVAIEDGGNILARNIYHNYPIHLATTKEIYNILHTAQEETHSVLSERDIMDKHEKTVLRVIIYIFINIFKYILIIIIFLIKIIYNK